MPSKAEKAAKRRNSEVLSLYCDAFWVYGRRGRQSKVVRFMLAHGRMFERGTPPPRRGGWYRAAKSCFRNAYRNVAIDPTRYVYCEGFCWIGEPSSSFNHAWFIDRQEPDVALDTTLNQDGEYQYFGIPIAWKCVCDALLAENAHASVLDYCEKKGTEGLTWLA